MENEIIHDFLRENREAVRSASDFIQERERKIPQSRFKGTIMRKNKIVSCLYSAEFRKEGDFTFSLAIFLTVQFY